MVSTQSPGVLGTEVVCGLRRRSGERYRRPSEGRTELGPAPGEVSPRRRLLLPLIQASDRRNPPAGRADAPSTQEMERPFIPPTAVSSCIENLDPGGPCFSTEKGSLPFEFSRYCGFASDALAPVCNGASVDAKHLSGGLVKDGTVRAIVHLRARCSAPTHEAGRIGAGERRVDEPGGLPVGLQRDTHGVEQHAQTEFPSSRSCLTKM